MAKVDTNGKQGLFLHEQLVHLHTQKYTDEASNIAFDDDSMESNYMLAMLWNLSVISHWIFSQCFGFFGGAKSKKNLGAT